MRTLLIVFTFFIQWELSAQQISSNEHEVGIGIGAANYYGDLNSDFGIQGMGPSFTGFWRYNIGSRFSINTGLSQMNLHYKDSYSGREFNNQRNLSFRTKITDIHTQFEINFLSFVKNVYFNRQGSKFTPYVFVGGGVFFFNPQAEYDGQWYNLQPLGTEGQLDRDYNATDKYNLYNFSLNYGLGIKYHLYRQFTVALELKIRRTYTDYIDDVSGTYPKIISLLEADKGIAYQLYDRSKELGNPVGKEGYQRGSNDGNDDYATLNFTVSWNFSKIFCPKDLNKYH